MWLGESRRELRELRRVLSLSQLEPTKDTGCGLLSHIRSSMCQAGRQNNQLLQHLAVTPARVRPPIWSAKSAIKVIVMLLPNIGFMRELGGSWSWRARGANSLVRRAVATEMMTFSRGTNMGLFPNSQLGCLRPGKGERKAAKEGGRDECDVIRRSIY
jgi:hypothetical protein